MVLVTGNESYFRSVATRIRKLSYKFASELWQLCLSLFFFSFLSLTVVGKLLPSCPLGFFVFVSLALTIPSIAITTACSKVLVKFSAFHENSVAVNTVTLSQNAVSNN